MDVETSVKPLDTMQKIDACLSADFESPFSKRSLSVIEKIKIAAADLLYGYKENLASTNTNLSKEIKSILIFFIKNNIPKLRTTEYKIFTIKIIIIIFYSFN